MNWWPELIKAIADLLKAVAWPTALAFVFWILRRGLLEALPSLFRRKVEVEGPGFKATFSAAEAEQQQAAVDNPTKEKLPETPALAPSDRAAIAIIEAQLRIELQGNETGQKEAVLIRALAQARLEGAHEFIYNRIFGSQIAFLKRLNEILRATFDDAREFFKPYAAQFPQIYDTYGFDNWLNFLITNSLVERRDNSLTITEFGRDFLTYIPYRRLPEAKAF